MPNVKPQSIVKRIDNQVAEAKINDKVVLLNIEHGNYYNFNQTSTDIWEWLKEPRTVDELSHMLANKYDCTTDTSYHDTVVLLEEMVKAELLSIE
jgi:hypothetical protein